MASGKEVFRMPEQYEYHGLAYPRKAFPPEHMDKARAVPTRETDVVVLSYPRTGTTVCIQLVSLLQCSNDAELTAMDNTPVYARVFFLEMQHLSGNEISRFHASPGPRIIKSHLPASLAQTWITGPSPCVAVLRNPKDTLVSLFHFLQGIPEFGPFSGTWDEFFAVYQDGSMYNGDSLDWSVQMWKERHRDNVHVMFHEDVVNNIDKEIAILAKFLRLEKTEQELEKVADRCRFSSMKKNTATNYQDTSYVPGFQFVRSGKIGEWKKYFTPKQNEWMDERIKAKLDGTGLSFQYE